MIKLSSLRIALFHNLEACGAKRALWNLARELHHHGHELDLHTFATADESFLPLAPFVRNVFVQDIKVPHLRLPARTPIFDQTMNVWQRLRHLSVIDRAHSHVARAINQGRYDLAFVHSGMFAHVPDLLRYLTVPSVFFCQEPSRRIHERPLTLKTIGSREENGSQVQKRRDSFGAKVDGLYYALSEPLYKRRYHQQELENLKYANCVLTNAYYTRELTYQVYGIFPQVNYLGVDADFFKPVPKIPKEHLVLSVGRFDTLKQHHVVIESVGHIPKQIRPDVAIIGTTKNPSYVQYLQDLAQSLDVRVHIQVSAGNEELVRWYNRAKAVVFVPILEPFGFISLEAMACGTPIIGVREGGIREVIQHDKNGILVNREPHEISNVIVRILQDDSFAREIGKKGREYVCDQWTWEKSYQQLMTYFESVLG